MKCAKCVHAFVPEGSVELLCFKHNKKPCVDVWPGCKDFEPSLFEWMFILVPAKRLQTRLTETIKRAKM